MKTFKRIILLLAVCLLPVLAFAGCDFFGKDDNNSDNNTQQPVVTYTFAKVNYHYQYNVAFEEYWQESYSIVKGETYYIEKFYTPPEKPGYTFLGYTLQEGGEGELVELPFGITGEGGKGKYYSLYAKYEPISYNVVYHLEGGTNDPENPTTATGKVTLKNRQERATFSTAGMKTRNSKLLSPPFRSDWTRRTPPFTATQNGEE